MQSHNKTKSKTIVHYTFAITLVLLMFGMVNCADENKDLSLLAKELKCQSAMERQNAFIEFHSLGKEAISYLIDEIADNNMTFICLHNPISSMISKGSLENYAGILAAYTIELILAREKLQIGGSGDSVWVFGSDPHNYIYSNGVIQRNDGNNLSPNDMKIIMNIYKTWWQQSQSRSIEGLRDEWQNGLRPLSGSDYSWI